ncbi:MAG: DUF2764 family protein [Bacteroidales bacterium]|nr:DUF2764 family protein [Bacteroidales bacterium]
MGTYYCLIAGLPEISLEDKKVSYTVSNFKLELDEALSKEDRDLIDLFFLYYDNTNLLRLLRNPEALLDTRGKYTADELAELIALVKETETPVDKRFPSYFFTFVAAILEERSLNEMLSLEDQLASLYYEYAAKASNTFIAEWFEMNLNVNNILSAIACRKLNRDAQSAILGNSEVSETIRQSAQRDLGLTGQLDYLEAILRITDEKDLYNKEQKLDLLRWRWLEEHTFFHYFTIERIFAYLVQLDMIERWISLNPEEGERIFRSIIDKLKKEVKLPENF